MIGVSDLLSLLDKLPKWKELSALPARVAELEKKLAAIESVKAGEGLECPGCGKKAFKFSEKKQKQINVVTGSSYGQVVRPGNMITKNLFCCSECDYTEER